MAAKIIDDNFICNFFEVYFLECDLSDIIIGLENDLVVLSGNALMPYQIKFTKTLVS